MKNIFLLHIPSIFGLFVGSLLAEPVATKENFKIGAILELENADVGVQNQAFRKGIELAAAMQNERGGIDGIQVQLIFEDSKGFPKEAVTSAKKLLHMDKVEAAINCSSIETMANGQLFERAKIPVITLWDSSPEIEELGPYNFSIGLWTPASGQSAASFCSSDLKAQTAVILYMNDSWSQKAATAFRLEFQGRGGNILNEFSFDPSQADFREILPKIQRSNPDVIYAPVTYNFIALFQQLKEAGIKAKIITSDVLTEAHLKQTPELLQGIYQSMHFPSPNLQRQSMEVKYREYYSTPPEHNQFVAWGFDALNLLVEAKRKAIGQNIPLQAALKVTSHFDGATGKISFLKSNSSPQYPKIFRINKAEFVDVSN